MLGAHAIVFGFRPMRLVLMGGWLALGIREDRPPVARWAMRRQQTRLDLSSCVVLDGSLGRVDGEVTIVGRSWSGAALLLRDLAIQPPHVGDLVRTTTLP
jgi:hypothetical protein